MIILRTHVFGARERALMEQLGTDHCHRVVVAADETRRTLDVGPYAKLSVTRAACHRLGLLCPADFTWRNGDYVLYLARNHYPEERQFWMLEPDVEHSFESFPKLFERFDRYADIDFLACYFNQTTEGWWWRQTGRPRASGVFRAMFSFVRLSARALDVGLRQRRRGRFLIRDRLLWPNDEVFMATELVHAGLQVRDLNDFGAAMYEPGSFGYEEPLDGDAGTFRTDPDRIFHPVLYGDAYRRRIERIHASWEVQGNISMRLRRRLQRML